MTTLEAPVPLQDRALRSLFLAWHFLLEVSCTSAGVIPGHYNAEVSVGGHPGYFLTLEVEFGAPVISCLCQRAKSVSDTHAMASSGLGVGFSGWDWAVFVVTLMASLGTGAFAGWVARRKTKKSDVKGTAAEFLMGGRELNLFAVALSTMIGALSSISILGNSAEMYAYGTQLCMSLIGTALGAVFVHLVNLRVFYPLKITSVYTVSCERHVDDLPVLAVVIIR
ncbi:Sodium-coupled monocarboxylate transporter 2 [Portunus trituberculatus]|uniref:Sodium-coupled monocarboxylate transporter 2 n=1 Tax=Portunus trituberculatus TaxID=210409 RepID=A0A5B7E8L4_PORTR|nr:Sodium-coupled monocarboxylate transporter 2 [Portunus trituberculatus]